MGASGCGYQWHLPSCCSAGLASVAAGQTSGTDFTTVSAPFTGASNFATGFTTTGSTTTTTSPPCTAGPAGLLDDGHHFFVADGFCGGALYRFPSTGGSASSAPSAPDGVFGYRSRSSRATRTGKGHVVANVPVLISASMS